MFGQSLKSVSKSGFCFPRVGKCPGELKPFFQIAVIIEYVFKFG